MTRKLVLLAALALATAGIARAEGFNVIETRQAGQDAMSGDYRRHPRRGRRKG